MFCSLLQLWLVLLAPAFSVAEPLETSSRSSCKRSSSCNSQWLLQHRSSVSQSSAQLSARGASLHGSKNQHAPSTDESFEDILKGFAGAVGEASAAVQKKACKASGPAGAFVQFVQTQKSPAADETGDANTLGSGAGIMGGKSSAAQTSSSSAVPGTAASTGSLALDFTNAFHDNDRISILVTVVTESGAYVDNKGFSETYGNNVGQYLELKVDRERSQIDVYLPPMSIRTSDRQSSGAVLKGAGDGWLDSWPLTPCPAASDAGRIIVPLDSLASQGFYLARVSDSITSKLLKSSAYPNNFDITVEYLGAVPVTMGFSVALLPSVPMAPRVSDDRVLFFTSQYTDMGSHNASSKLLPWQNVDKETSLIWRWDISKLKNRTIRVHIDPTVPERWRQAFKEGVETWNDAFEQLEQPVRVQGVLPGSAEWPKDYDIADVRFSTVAWSISDSAISMGNSKVDPRSGEIVKADITMSDKWVSAYLRELEDDDVVPKNHAAISMSEAMLSVASRTSTPSREPEDRRSHVLSTGLGLLLAQRAQQDIRTDKPDLEEILSSGLRNIVMHETGHILGLRHNFKGSLAATTKCLQDVACTAKEGIGSSVMDYVPINLPKPGGPQVHAFSPVVGGYDKLAIRYGYAPAHELPQILAEAELRYSTCYDEDEDFGQDPFCTPYDLGENPVEFINDQLNLFAHLQQGLLNKSVLAGQPYVAYGNAVASLVRHVYSLGMDLATYLGGIQNEHRHADEIAADGRKQRWARKPVPLEVQRQALQLLLKVLHPDRAGLLPPAQDLPFLVEGEPEGDWVQSLDLENTLENYSQQVMHALISGTRLQKVRFQEQLLSDSKETQTSTVFSVSEVLATVGASVFGFSLTDASAAPNMNLFNKSESLPRAWGLQKAFIAALKDLYLNQSLPEDLTTDILAELNAVQTAVLEAGRIVGSEDTSTMIHLQAHLDLMSRDLSEVFCMTGDICGAPRVPFRVSPAAKVHKSKTSNASNETVTKDSSGRMLPCLIALGLLSLLRWAE